MSRSVCGVCLKMVDQWFFFNGENDDKPLDSGIPYIQTNPYIAAICYVFVNVYGIDLPFSFVGAWTLCFSWPLGNLQATFLRSMTSPVIRRLRGLFQSRMKPVPRLQTQCHWSPKAKNLRRDEVLERQPMLGSRGTIQASWFNWRHSLFLMQIRFIPWRCFFRLCGQWRWAARFLERILKFLFDHIWIHFVVCVSCIVCQILYHSMPRA